MTRNAQPSPKCCRLKTLSTVNGAS